MITLNKALRTAAAGAVLISGLFAATASFGQDEGSIARGGRLYDKWYKEAKLSTPEESHVLYPAANEKYAGNPGANWRCKECHGWDGKGVNGAYASGKHSTGIIGINGMAGADPAAIIAVLTGDAHGFGDKLSEADLNDLANFVSNGQVDMDQYIDFDTKTPKGDAAVGEQVYNTVCSNCHGADGKLPSDMPPLGSLMGNPWEIMHKILNGQPNEKMPALRAIDHQVTVDLLAYLATLPAE